MTAPTPVPDLIQAAPWPVMGAPNYNDAAYAAGSSQPAAFARQGEIAETAYVNALSAAASAQAAVAAAASAASVQEVVLAAANFKDEWPSMAGQLNKPACVKHKGRFWLLRNNLANVAASEPALGNADWASLDAGVTPSQVITANTVAVPGVRYILGASGITLDFSAVAYAKGDYQGIRTLDGVAGCAVEFAALKYLGRTVGTVMIDVPLFRLDLNYESTAVGMQ